MPYHALSERQQMDAAEVAGTVERYALGDRRRAPLDEAKAAVRAVSDDPAVLGEVLGDYLHRVVVGAQADAARYWPVLDLLRAAGADEDVARERAAWLRRQPSDDTAL
jgi:hypothetical protein